MAKLKILTCAYVKGYTHVSFKIKFFDEGFIKTNQLSGTHPEAVPGYPKGDPGSRTQLHCIRSLINE